jgi:heme/copper-type cytochrome/quinol oxidase subunit 2
MDPQQQQQFAGMMAGFMGVFILIGIVVIAFFIFLFWRVLSKAGLSGPLALLVLIWPIGPLIVLCILAFSDWRVVPAPLPYGGLQPYPPPPTNYPPPPPTSFNPPPPPQP